MFQQFQKRLITVSKNLVNSVATQIAVDKLKGTDQLAKEDLVKLINKMETQMVQGGHGLEENEKEHVHKIRAMQLKLKKERK